MTLGDSWCDQCVESVGVVTGSSGWNQWLGPVDVVTGLQWVVDILLSHIEVPTPLVSVLFGSFIPTFYSIFVN